jgi:hypothetical protein
MGLKDPFPFADSIWVVGLVVSFLIYGILTMVAGNRTARAEEERATPWATTRAPHQPRDPSTPRRGLAVFRGSR